MQQVEHELDGPQPELVPTVTHDKNHQESDSRTQSLFAAAKAAGLHDEPLGYDAKGNAIYELNPYSLRHGFAEKMVDKGIDLETLRDVMGHKDLETTKKYVNPDKETPPKSYPRSP